ncbi:MAG: hypothetical protein IT361_10440 [Gemmatimonadaceae bacterium]|nr:hypothetical protein [Gemmatimonadaceae bacterium]
MMRGTLRWPSLGSALILSAVALAMPLNEARAQQATLPIAPGTRVRVRAANLVAPLVANFVQMRGDTAVFIEDAAGRGIWSLHVNDITRLERSDGERRVNRPYIIRGALVGTAAGAAGGFLIAASLKPSDSSKKYSRAASGIAGAAVGALLGGIVGSRFGAERWTGVALPRRVSVLPQGHGIGVRFGFDF